MGDFMELNDFKIIEYGYNKELVEGNLSERSIAYDDDLTEEEIKAIRRFCRLVLKLLK